MSLTHISRFVIAVAVAGGLLVTTAGARVPTPRTLYFSAADAAGAPVTDLTAADLTLKEGGKDQKIDAVTPATEPMDIAMIIDDGGTGAFQGATAEFLNKMLGHAQFSVRLINTQALKIQEYTADLEPLKAMIGKLGQRGRVRPDGDQLLEAVNESAKELQKRKTNRRVIVAFTAFGEEGKAIDPQNVLNTLRDTGAALNVLYVRGASTGQMIGDGTKQSGGRVEQVHAGAGIQPAAGKIADILLHQMVLTYTLPDGTKPSDRVALSTSKKGVTLLAPSRIPDK
jgi:hypothetical protein